MLYRTPLLAVVLESADASPLRRTGEENQFTMDHTKDRFIHFTTHDKARSILRDQTLRRPPGDPDESVFAVSTTYGGYVPGVQTTQHMKPSRRTERLQAAHRRADPGPRADRLRRLVRRSRGLDAKRAELPKTLSAVIFSTKTRPHVGFPEETTWKSDVDLHNAKIVPMKTARAMLRKAPHKIDDPHYVLYRDDGTSK